MQLRHLSKSEIQEKAWPNDSLSIRWTVNSDPSPAVFWDSLLSRLSLHSTCFPPAVMIKARKKGLKVGRGERNSNSLGEVAWSNVPQKKVHLISREWGHSVSSLAHNFQSSNPNVLSRALIIIRNCSMKRAISLQWNTLSTSGWASITNLFPWDQLKRTITIFSFLNNSLNGSIKKKIKPAGQKNTISTGNRGKQMWSREEKK